MPAIYAHQSLSRLPHHTSVKKNQLAKRPVATTASSLVCVSLARRSLAWRSLSAASAFIALCAAVIVRSAASLSGIPRSFAALKRMVLRGLLSLRPTVIAELSTTGCSPLPSSSAVLAVTAGKLVKVTSRRLRLNPVMFNRLLNVLRSIKIATPCYLDIHQFGEEIGGSHAAPYFFAHCSEENSQSI